MADWDVLTASEEFLADLSHKTQENEGRIGGEFGGPGVVKLSPQIAVKLGHGITASEAATQDFAHKNLDPSVAYVPKVYRYFRSRSASEYGDELGYLFMEYIPGQNLKDLDMESLVKLVPRLVNIVTSLGQISGLTPGPIGDGIPRGYIYGDDGAKTRLNSLEEMNVYMNKRLVSYNQFAKLRRGVDCNYHIDLRRYPLVLCHGDLCRRNIVLRDDGSLCLLDWGFAGFYPRFFEVAALKCILRPYDKLFQGALESATEAMMDLTDEERHDKKLIMYVRTANLRWSFDGPTKEEHDAFIKNLERQAGILPKVGFNSPDQVAAGVDKQEEPDSISQPTVKSD
ncbi:hypothetical protein FE257_008238 [Aspergillus nanangensis]|uniref:Aminoglycoside phosphotransferase domain-containing protein n=1 Tax=Aspergillus nanangensis TaxID=2582783 RepID=A0AAD4GSV0_ASPNN|nr:hypothetical protein FE257_008238 [Aspergillus nanangensis]